MTNDNVPVEIIDQLEDLIDQDNLDCADNCRYALESDLNQVNAYYVQRDRGCCGCADYQVLDKHGNIWLVGCNYGH
jgi:hypothetical protein